MRYPVTPDGRYFVVRGRLWRMPNPALDPATRQALVRALMPARRAVRESKDDPDALRAPRPRVQAATRRLGERRPVWWSAGAPDLNRRMPRHTPYPDRFAAPPP